MTYEDSVLTEAGIIGTEHGRSAAGFWFGECGSQFEIEAVLRGITVGDPLVMDSLPSSPLSGEWADDYSVRDLCDELGFDMDDRESHAFDTDETVAEICAAYEVGFYSASQSAITAACLDYLRGAGVEVESL